MVAWDGTAKVEYGKNKGIEWREVSSLWLDKFLATNDAGKMVDNARSELLRRAEVSKTQVAPFITYDRHLMMYKDAYVHQQLTPDSTESVYRSSDERYRDSLTKEELDIINNSGDHE